MPDVTRLLESVVAGDRRAAADLLPLVYDELRKLAAAHMARERAGHSVHGDCLRGRVRIQHLVDFERFRQHMGGSHLLPRVVVSIGRVVFGPATVVYKHLRISPVTFGAHGGSKAGHEADRDFAEHNHLGMCCGAVVLRDVKNRRYWSAVTWNRLGGSSRCGRIFDVRVCLKGGDAASYMDTC